MSKKIKWLGRGSLYAIRENERWFEDMAKQGLHLKGIELGFAFFEKGEPLDTKYCIINFSEWNEANELDNVLEWGWEFITDKSNSYIFSSSKDGQKKDLQRYFNQEQMLEELEATYKGSIRIVIALGLSLALLIFDGRFMERLTPEIVDGSISGFEILILIQIHRTLIEWCEYKAIRKSRQDILEDSQIAYDAKRGTTRRLSLFFNLIFWGLMTFLIMGPYFMNY